MIEHTRATAAANVMNVAVEALETYAGAEEGAANRCGHDAGPMVLAFLAYTAGGATADLAQQVTRRWLSELPEQIHSVGAFGGLGGFIAGVRAGIKVDSQLSSLADALNDQTRPWLRAVEWRTSLVAWRDYDLFTGPSGLVLAGAASGGSTEHLAPAARHLELLCDEGCLERLRAGTEIDPRSAFNIGRINTGLAHGVTGVASALRHVVETFEDGSDYLPALKRACAWLAQEVYLADCGLITWPPVGLEGASPSFAVDDPQAWCYGTPGVAWTLWDAGRVLDDSSFQVLGEEAMRSFCRVFDDDRFLARPDMWEALSICHGAAGTLAVADAFARHADLGEAASLRDYLDQYLMDRIDDIVDLARVDMTMLTGAGGVLSVMLTAHDGARDWLRQLALR
jgi:hypothetical protein